MTTVQQAQIPAIHNYYARKVVPERLETIEFRTLLVPQTGSPINLDGAGLAAEWVDASSVLQGTLTMQTPQFGHNNVRLGHGNEVRLDVRWGKPWVNLWRMRVWDPDDDLVAGSLSCPLFDDLVILQRSKDDFRYVRNKKSRPNGWYCHEIVREIAKRYNLPLGHIAEGKHLIKSMTLFNASPLDAIVQAYRLEREGTGRRFYLRWINGRLNILPLQRNPIMYVLKDAFLTAVLSQTTPDNFTTALTGRATIKKHGSKKSEKIVVTERKNTDRFGFIHQQMAVHGVDTEHEVRTQVRRRLAKLQKIKHTATITHPGIPWVRRGDAIDIEIPERGLSGDKAIMWCSAVTHTLDAGNYQMAPTLVMDDPLKDAVATRKKKDAATRAKKRKTK